ncbi:MAG TPA: hypothetical protein PLO37_15685 [Candidatus Hydrogenedentes bacterium]|nr:hypothetical protein [Candidatus Hydrogenedentota bacterium]HPG68288.1 hypothetical protein [Candidatus Hydrogenedentota bacterium]
MSKKRAKQEQEFYGAAVLGKFYQQGRLYITLSDQTLQSDAWLVLTPLQRSILLDLMRTIRNKFRETPPDQARKHGFTYTYSECRVLASENAFHGGMQELKRVGWVDILAEHQREAIAGPVYYAVSDRWKSYAMDDQERGKTARKRRSRQRRLDENLKRKQDLFNAQ